MQNWELYFPLEKNIGRWIGTRSGTYRGVIIGAKIWKTKPLAHVLTIIDVLDFFPPRNKIKFETYTARGKTSSYINKISPTKYEIHAVIKFMFENSKDLNVWLKL